MGNIGRTANPTDSGSANYNINEIALAQGLDSLKSSLVVAGLVTNYSAEAKNQGSRYGQSVRVPKRGTVTAQNKLFNTAVTPQSATTTKADIALNKFKTVDILVEDSASLMSQDIMSGYAKDGASAIAEAVETDTIACYANASRILGSANAGASTTLIRAIKKASRDDKWRGNANKFIVWGAEAENDLLALDLFVKANESGSTDTLVNGAIGKKFGFIHLVSDLMPAVSGSPTAEHGMAFQSEGIGIAFVDMSMESLPEAFRPQGVNMVAFSLEDDLGNPVYSMRMIVGYSQKDKGTLVSVDSMYGVAVVQDKLVYDILV